MTDEQTIDETTTDTEVQETVTDATQAQETPPEDEQTTEPEDGTKAGREAAKLRKRAQAAESERDALTERVATLQRGEVERQAAVPGGLADGADLWSAVDLEALQDEHGNIDAEAVTQAVAELLTAKPHYAYRRFQGRSDGGVKAQSIGETSDPWAEAGDAIRRGRK